ncbi:MAG: DUF4199 domain-containing protein [Bacteroidota bacterium]
MEEKMKSAFMPSLMPGIYLGFALIIYTLILFVLDIDMESPAKYVSYVLMAVGLYLSIVSFRDKHLDGFISYGKAFSAGFYTGLFASLLGAIFTLFYVQYIDTELIANILIVAEEGMLEQNPDMSNEQLDQALSMTEMFTSPIMLGVISFIANLLLSAVLSLIIAIFAKRENQNIA